MDFTNEGFLEVVSRLKGSGRPFAVATVIHVKGSASAKPGSRAVIDETGKNIFGWVGGGCAESFVGREAVLAMEENRTRIVQADLDDEIFGLGMPCGGIMDVFIQPQLPPERVKIQESVELEPVLRHLASGIGLELSFEPGRGAPFELPLLERGVWSLARAVGEARGASFQSLRKTKGVYLERALDGRDLSASGELLILGHSRITEELAKLAAVLKWPSRVYGPGLERDLYPLAVRLEDAGPGYENMKLQPGTAVIVASHHKGDHEFIRLALEQGAGYVGLIASQKRSGLVFDHLRATLGDAALRTIHAPAGLDLACKNPQEIALSCLAEIIGLRASSVSAPILPQARPEGSR